jgi:hypothetical protein
VEKLSQVLPNTRIQSAIVSNVFLLSKYSRDLTFFLDQKGHIQGRMPFLPNVMKNTKLLNKIWIVASSRFISVFQRIQINIFKMYKLLFPAFLFVLCLQNNGNAQNSDYRSNISGQWALNGWQLIALGDNIINADTVVGGYAKATGTFGLAYDRSFLKWFSLGLQGTYNKGRIGADNLSVVVKGKTYTGNAEIQLNRINFGIRPMFHYFNNDRFDWYSGFRIGINYISTRVDIGTDQNITDNAILDELIGNNWFLNRSYNSVRPTFQFVPIGMRGYITDNIGFGVETAVGPTYYLSANINYRF